MLLRIIVYMLGVTLTWKMVDYVYNRNFAAGIYPPEADSISIPIFSNQIFLAGLCMVALPTVALGNRWVFNQIVDLRRWIQIVIVLFFIGFYFLSIFLSLALTASHLDHDHLEVGISGGAILLPLVGFFIWDLSRFYRQLRKQISAAM